MTCVKKHLKKKLCLNYDMSLLYLLTSVNKDWKSWKKKKKCSLDSCLDVGYILNTLKICIFFKCEKNQNIIALLLLVFNTTVKQNATI